MKEERANIIKAITTPLGFFALSLLIVEGFLGITLGLAKNQNEYFYFSGMIIGAILFILVVILVWLLVWFKPRNIVLAGKDYIEIEKTKNDRNKTIKKYIRNTNETTKDVKLDDYYDQPTEEEIDAAGDRWIQSQIDQERGK